MLYAAITFLAWAGASWFSRPFEQPFLNLFIFGIDPVIPFISAILCALGALIIWIMRTGSKPWEKALKWIKENKITLLLLASIILFHFALRLAFIFNYRGANIADTAFYGLEGYHIAEGKTRPMFCYGKHYIGSLIPHLTAPLNIAFGKCPVYLQLINTIFYLGFIVSLFALVRRLFDERIALLSALLASIPPFEVLTYLKYTEYPEILLWGTLSLYLISKMQERDRPTLRQYFWYGVVAGLGFWAHPQVSYFIACGLVVLFVRDKLFFVRPQVLTAPLGFLAGGIVNFVNAFYYEAKLFSVFTPGGDPWRLFTSIPQGAFIFFSHWPKYLGTQDWRGVELFYAPVTWIAVLLFAGCIFLSAFRAREQLIKIFKFKNVQSGAALFLVLLFVVLVIFSAYERANKDVSFNYMWPFWPVVVVTIAEGIYQLANANKTAAAVVAASFILVFLTSMAMTFPVLFDREHRLQMWEKFCYDRGITHFYGPWVRTYLNNFVTRETIIGSSIYPKYQFEPYLPYQNIVDNLSDKPAFLFVPNDKNRMLAFENHLENLKIGYRKSQTPMGLVFYDFSERITPRQLINLSSQPYEASINPPEVFSIKGRRDTASLRFVTITVKNTGEAPWKSNGTNGFIELLVFNGYGRVLRRQPLSSDVEPGNSIQWRSLLDTDEAGGETVSLEVRVNDFIINRGKEPIKLDLSSSLAPEPIPNKDLDVTRSDSFRRQAESVDYIFFSGWGATRIKPKGSLVRLSSGSLSTIGFVLARKQPVKLSLRLTPVKGRSMPQEGQWVSISCNENPPLKNIFLSKGSGWDVEIPTSHLNVGINLISLQYRRVEPDFWPDKRTPKFSFRPRAVAVEHMSFRKVK